ncbi:MAG: twin-arginine translocase TatA/TatE family subunit [Bacillota bacterium]|nr:twin-arginine translocase TatA/TatE family subunit [Bacillota bacterium]
MPFNIGLPELLVILFICLIVFGAGKLPGVGRALGQSLREFRQASQGKAESEKSGSGQPGSGQPGSGQEGAVGAGTESRKEG